MDERKHNVIRFHWIRDIVLSGIIFCLCDLIMTHKACSFNMFWEGVKFKFIFECVFTTIYNGLFDISKEDGGNI